MHVSDIPKQHDDNQGSTRSTPSISQVSHSIRRRYPDTKLVWTLEEYFQQKAGRPREFTFVFLMERPQPRSPPKRSSAFHNVTQSIESSIPTDSTRNETAPRWFRWNKDPKSSKGFGNGGVIESMKPRRICNYLHSEEEIPYYRWERDDHRAPAHLDDDYETVFTDIELSVLVKANVAGTHRPKQLFRQQPQLSVVGGRSRSDFYYTGGH